VLLYGITGGIGTGKSAVAEMLVAGNVPVADTDLIARQVVEPGQPALVEIRDRFGAEMIDGAGRLRRGLMAQRVFGDPEARQKLEAILHPRIRAIWRAQAARWRAAGIWLGVVVIPLLFETGAETELDRTLAVACSRATQEQRLLARGWSRKEIQQRVGAQWPMEKKLARADYLVWTEGSKEVTAEQVARVFHRPEGFKS
jgi:dephospho-CoA kinase